MGYHQFEPDIAMRVGVNAAVIHQNLLFWTAKNAANGKHFHEGKYWTYNSNKAFEILFPYLTSKQIRTSLDKLIKDGLVLSGNFNKSPYDRTRWFSPLSQHDLPQRANGNRDKGEPIPDTKPDTKPDKRDSVSEFDQFLEISPSKEGLAKARVAFNEAREKVSFETLIDSMQAYREACERKKTKERYILQPANWLIDERWTDAPDQPCAKSPAAKPVDQAAKMKYYGDILKGDGFIPAGMFTTSLAEELFESGEVTAEVLQARLG